jgi:hypothetical protein
MAHPEWCGKLCAECIQSCTLDESMSCSPDCPGLNPETGEPRSDICKDCDAIHKELDLEWQHDEDGAERVFND